MTRSLSRAMKGTFSHERRGLLGRPLAAACLVLALTLATGCAYFNTLYNAKRLHQEAVDIPRVRDGTLSPQANEKYKQVIEKCESLIANYPKSKYVDDAVLLIGKCLYEQGEYDDAIERLDELETISKDEDTRAEGRLYRAKSFIGKGDLETAVPIVKQLVDENPKKVTDETFFLLGTSLVRMGNEADAVKYLEMLARRYPQSPYRVRADLEAAEVYAEKEEYDKAASVYSRLETVRMAEGETVRYLRGLGKLHADRGEYEESIATFKKLDGIVVDPVEKAGDVLVLGRAYEGMESLSVAVDTYKSVTTSYPRSMFSAEAYFRLGEIYQNEMDSLETAKQQFDQVPQQYAGSPFAEEAISRSAAISKLLRARESLESGEGGDPSVAEFDLAEIELFQFKDYAKAIEGYRRVLDEAPDGDLAPRAAYAIAYIYDVHLKDPEKAQEAYEYVVNRYPDTQQAQYAREALDRIAPERQP
jgi:TolA-binding protein